MTVVPSFICRGAAANAFSIVSAADCANAPVETAATPRTIAIKRFMTDLQFNFFTAYRSRPRRSAKPPGLLLDNLKLLPPPAPVGLRHIEIAAGVERDRVAVNKIANLVSGAAEAG